MCPCTHPENSDKLWLFVVSSAVVMNAAYFQFNLLLGLGKTLDCWCADMIESEEFISGIKSWNSMQALLKCIGRRDHTVLHSIESPRITWVSSLH